MHIAGDELLGLRGRSPAEMRQYVVSNGLTRILEAIRIESDRVILVQGLATKRVGTLGPAET
jgi:hypothetical protein